MRPPSNTTVDDRKAFLAWEHSWEQENARNIIIYKYIYIYMIKITTLSEIHTYTYLYFRFKKTNLIYYIITNQEKSNEYPMPIYTSHNNNNNASHIY